MADIYVYKYSGEVGNSMGNPEDNIRDSATRITAENEETAYTTAQTRLMAIAYSKGVVFSEEPVFNISLKCERKLTPQELMDYTYGKKLSF